MWYSKYQGLIFRDWVFLEYKLGNIGVGWSVVLCILVWFRQTQYFYEKDGRTANIKLAPTSTAPTALVQRTYDERTLRQQLQRYFGAMLGLSLLLTNLFLEGCFTYIICSYTYRVTGFNLYTKLVIGFLWNSLTRPPSCLQWSWSIANSLRCINEWLCYVQLCICIFAKCHFWVLVGNSSWAS